MHTWRSVNPGADPRSRALQTESVSSSKPKVTIQDVMERANGEIRALLGTMPASMTRAAVACSRNTTRSAAHPC